MLRAICKSFTISPTVDKEINSWLQDNCTDTSQRGHIVWKLDKVVRTDHQVIVFLTR